MLPDAAAVVAVVAVELEGNHHIQDRLHNT